MGQRKKNNFHEKEMLGQNRENQPIKASTEAKPSAIATYDSLRPIGRYPMSFAIGLLLFLPTIAAPLWSKYGYSPDLHMAAMIQFGVTLLFTVFFFSQIKKGYCFFVPSPLLYAVLGFYVWALLSLIWAYNRFESMISLLDWGAGVLAFLLILHNTREANQIKILVNAIFLTGVLLSFLGVCQYLFDVQWVQQHAKPSATFNNKNMAAQYTLITIALGFGLLWSTKNRSLIWAYAIGTFLITLFVFYTFTRGATLATLAIFLFMGIFLFVDRFVLKNKGPMNQEKWVAIAVGCVLFFVLGMFSAEGFIGVEGYHQQIFESSYVFTNEFDTNTLQRGTRLDMWQNSTAMIKDHPLIGVGMGNWMVYYPLYQTAVSIDREMSEAIQHINAHNDYVEIFSDLGIIGFALLLGILITATYVSLKNFYQNRENPNRFLLLGVLLAAVGISVNAIGSFPFKQPAPILITCSLLAIMASEYARWQNVNLIAVKNRVLICVLGGLFLIATIGAFMLHQRWNQSEIHFRLATISSHQKKFHRMISEGLKSHEALPLRDRMYNFVGMGHLRTGNSMKAAEYLELVKRAYPHRNNTLQNLGYVYLEIAEVEKKKKNYRGYLQYLNKAEENFSHFVDIRPDNPRARKNLGITYYRQATVLRGKVRSDKMIAAANQIDISIEINPDDKDNKSLSNLSKRLRVESKKLLEEASKKSDKKKAKTP